MRIFKYPIPVEDEFKIPMPTGARVLCVQTQREQPYVWVLVNEHAEPEPKAFWLRGTGHPADGLLSRTYVGTFQLRGGSLVFHLFC